MPDYTELFHEAVIKEVQGGYSGAYFVRSGKRSDQKDADDLYLSAEGDKWVKINTRNLNTADILQKPRKLEEETLELDAQEALKWARVFAAKRNYKVIFKRELIPEEKSLREFEQRWQKAEKELRTKLRLFYQQRITERNQLIREYNIRMEKILSVPPDGFVSVEDYLSREMQEVVLSFDLGEPFLISLGATFITYGRARGGFRTFHFIEEKKLQEIKSLQKKYPKAFGYYHERFCTRCGAHFSKPSYFELRMMGPEEREKYLYMVYCEQCREKVKQNLFVKHCPHCGLEMWFTGSTLDDLRSWVGALPCEDCLALLERKQRE